MTFLLFLVLCLGVAALMRLPITARSADALLQRLVEACAAYLIIYCLVANVLLLFSTYSGESAIYGATLIALGATLIAAQRGRLVPWPHLHLSPGDRSILLFSLMMGPVVIERYEFLVLKGDAGVYSVSAIHLAARGQLVDTLPVRDLLSPDLRRIYDRDNLLAYDPSTRRGYYFPGTYLTDGSQTTYDYQFYPTWPLLLAGWGSIFGLAKMHFVLVFLYVQCVWLFDFILRALRPPRLLHTAGLVLFGSSPLLVHFSKYPTSEVFLLFLFLLTVHLLLTGDAGAAILAGLAVTVFCLTHISAFMYMPLLGLLLVGAWGGARRPLGCFLLIAFLGWAFSFPYGYRVSEQYLRDIFSAVSGLLGLTLAEFIALLLLAGMAGAGAAAYTLTRGSWVPGGTAISQWISRPSDSRLTGAVIRVWLLALLARTTYNAYLLGWSTALIPLHWTEWNSWSAREAYVNRGFVSLLHLNCVSIAMATGLAILPATAIALFRKPETVCKNTCVFLVTLTLLVALSIYTFAGIDTTNNYYASRYFLPVLFPSLLLTFAVVGQQFRPALVVLLVAPGLLFNIRHDSALYLRPAFQGNFTLIKELLQTIPPHSTVFLDARPFSRRLLTQPLRYLGDVTPISIANDQPRGAVERRQIMERYAKELNISDAYVITEAAPENDTCRTFRLEHEEQPWMILYPTTMNHSTFVYHVYREHFGADRL